MYHADEALLDLSLFFGLTVYLVNAISFLRHVGLDLAPSDRHVDVIIDPVVLKLVL